MGEVLQVRHESRGGSCEASLLPPFTPQPQCWPARAPDVGLLSSRPGQLQLPASWAWHHSNQRSVFKCNCKWSQPGINKWAARCGPSGVTNWSQRHEFRKFRRWQVGGTLRSMPWFHPGLPAFDDHCHIGCPAGVQPHPAANNNLHVVLAASSNRCMWWHAVLCMDAAAAAATLCVPNCWLKPGSESRRL